MYILLNKEIWQTMKAQKISHCNAKDFSKDAQYCACLNLRKAARVVTQYYDGIFRGMGFRSTQIGILSVLFRQGALTMNQLAEITVTDRTTLTRSLRLLEREGLVTVQSGSDKRERVVELKAKGRKVVERAYDVWQDGQARLVEKIGAARFRRMLNDLTVATEAAAQG